MGNPIPLQKTKELIQILLEKNREYKLTSEGISQFPINGNYSLAREEGIVVSQLSFKYYRDSVY
jgi:hypothetical protein